MRTTTFEDERHRLGAKRSVPSFRPPDHNATHVHQGDFRESYARVREGFAAP